MRTASLALLSCLAGLAVGWFLRAGMTAGDSVRAVALPPADSAERSEPRNSANLESGLRESRPAERLPVGGTENTAVAGPAQEPSVKAALASLESVLSVHPHFDGQTGDFLMKYENCSVDEMRVALFVLERTQARDRARIVDERLKSGAFQTEVVAQGEPLPRSLGKTSPEHPIASFGWHATNAGGIVTYQITDIPAEEYPEFHDLEMEVWWLNNHLHELGVPLEELR